METRKPETPYAVEITESDIDESKTLPTTEEMISVLEADPYRCLSWL